MIWIILTIGLVVICLFYFWLSFHYKHQLNKLRREYNEKDDKGIGGAFHPGNFGKFEREEYEFEPGRNKFSFGSEQYPERDGKFERRSLLPPLPSEQTGYDKPEHSGAGVRRRILLRRRR